jgi:DNA-binding CsgD family transcriptional regulator
MNPFAGLMTPMLDRPCVERRGTGAPRSAVQWPPRRDLPAVANPWELTPMQCAVMGLLAEGNGRNATADKLGVNPKTVDSHLERIMQKMDAATKKQALDIWTHWSRANREAA